MKNKERIKRLTWKYFWEQKLEELLKVVFYSFISLIAIILTSLFGRWVDVSLIDYIGGDLICTSNNLSCNFVYLIAGIFVLFVIGLIFALLYFPISGWIESNWKKAKSKAISEVKK